MVLLGQVTLGRMLKMGVRVLLWPSDKCVDSKCDRLATNDSTLQLTVCSGYSPKRRRWLTDTCIDISGILEHLRAIMPIDASRLVHQATVRSYGAFSTIFSSMSQRMRKFPHLVRNCDPTSILPAVQDSLWIVLEGCFQIYTSK